MKLPKVWRDLQLLFKIGLSEQASYHLCSPQTQFEMTPRRVRLHLASEAGNSLVSQNSYFS